MWPGNGVRGSLPIGVTVEWCNVPNGIYHDGVEPTTAKNGRVEPVGVNSFALTRLFHLILRGLLATFPVYFRLVVRVSVLQALHNPPTLPTNKIG